ncbi:MAG: prenyltransferase/squalene oxidase repeat-containing protein [Pirellulaceae bacterium]
MVKPVPTKALLLFAAVTAFGFLFPESLVAQEFAVARNAQEIKTAVIKSLKLLETTAAKTAESRSCFTCHGQALPVLAMAQAQQRGLTIDQENLNRQLKHTHDHLSEGRADYLQGKGLGGQVDTAGWAAITLKAGGWTADEVTAAVAEYLLKYHAEKDHWSSSSNRPPSEVSDFSATYAALVTLDQFGTSEQQPRIATRKKQVKQWLLSAEARDTEDQVFRLHSLRQLAVAEETILEKVRELTALQRDDGGWAQTAEMTSDAYATSTVLVALQQAGKLPVANPVYQRGIEYLLKTQNEDGSWKVVTRSKPFQTYFESGFPHGADQFISTNATGWAVIALLPAIPQ